MSLSDPEFVALQTALRGRYSIEQELGRGGMGVVYLAHDVQLERPVAIKLLAPDLAADATMRSRFLREARLAAMCFHPNIVPIHSVEESGALAWFVMAYVRGESLAERVRRTGPLAADDVRRLAQDIGWALAYAHERGVVHRDVKPENILIDATSERFLLVDFGIALQNDTLADSVPRSNIQFSATHAIRSDATDTPAPPPNLQPERNQAPKLLMNGAAGTPRYMAPEQARGDAVDGRADLYSLGASLFHAATGRPPFDAATASSLLYQHATVTPPNIRTFAPSLAPNLADAIDQCLAKLPDDRFPNAALFVGAVKPMEADRALPPSLRTIHDNMRDAKNSLGWASAIAAATIFLVIGEGHNTWSRDIILALGIALSSTMAGIGLLRGGEATIATRRALKSGIDAGDAIRALTGRTDSNVTGASNRGRNAIIALAGAALGVAQGWLADLSVVDNLPEFLNFAVEVSLLFGPAYMIGRTVPGVARGTRVANWLHKHVAAPTARMLTRIAGAFLPARSRNRHILEVNAPTEIRLEHAVRSAMDRLPMEQRQLMQGANAAANGLAEEARRLREEDAALLARERLTRQEPTGPERSALLQSLNAQRIAARNRLTSAVAALETLRLDLLRLDAATPSRGGLTTQLDAVRDLARRVDAASELRAYLAHSTPTPV